MKRSLLLAIAALLHAVLGCGGTNSAPGVLLDLGSEPDTASIAEVASEPDIPVPAPCTMDGVLNEDFQDATRGWTTTGLVVMADNGAALEGAAALELKSLPLPNNVAVELDLTVAELGPGDSFVVGFGDAAEGEGLLASGLAGGGSASISLAGQDGVIAAALVVGAPVTLRLERRGETVTLLDQPVGVGPLALAGVVIRSFGSARIVVHAVRVSACDLAAACSADECGDSDACGGGYCNPLAGCGTLPAEVVCDDGVACTLDSCSPDLGCNNAVQHAVCDDGDPCTGLETCDGDAGCTPGEPVDGCCLTHFDCDDGDVCDGQESCGPDGQCVSGTPLQCNDANTCNGAESCDPLQGCLPGTPLVCGDDNLCNGVESCDPLKGCQNGVPLACDDQNACTAETCNPQTGCTLSLVTCDDGNVCNGIEACDPDVGCVEGVAPVCDDGKPCNGVEFCLPDSGCKVGVPQPGCCKSVGDCDDASVCNGTGVCHVESGTCQLAPPPVCDDGNACNGAETCTALAGCVPGVPPQCTDGNVCNGSESCDPGTGCVAGAPLDCSSTNVCQGQNFCSPTLGCQVGPPPVCDDGNLCNGVETCHPVAGCIAGVGPQCNDGKPCNGLESCHPETGCNAATGAAPLGCCTAQNECDDGNPCNGSWTCDTQTGACQGTAAPLACASDGDNPCGGLSYCDPQSGCVVTDPLDCDDGNACNGAETCDVQVGCVPGTPPACDDGNACNGLESCDALLGCVGGAPLMCNDGQACNGVETCDPDAGCQPGVSPKCDDGNPCNGLETCDANGGCVSGTPVSCGDGNACNGVEVCDILAGCKAGAALVCDDGDLCNGAESCNPAAGCVAGVQKVCDDTNPCNGAESCHAEKGCVAGAPLVCDDQNACTGIETCSPVSGCVSGQPVTCSDGNPCNGVETCDKTSGCVGGVALSCDDGNVCNGVETCDQGSGCVGGSPVTCNDGDPCNGTESCDLEKGCVSSEVPKCDDGDPCNGLEGCEKDKGCVVVGTLDCNDNNACTADTCQNGGCVHTPLDVACDDGEACTHSDSCAGGNCTGVGYGCEDGLSCTNDLCDGSGGCLAEALAAFCVIDGLCLPDGTVDPLNGCQHCLAFANNTAWLPKNGTCSLPNTDGSACLGGGCVVQACTPPFESCDQDHATGCETDVTSDVVHCGKCDAACALPGAAVHACIGGVCEAALCADQSWDLNGDPTDGCEADVLWVDDDADPEVATGAIETPFKSITAALASAQASTVIRIKAGTYGAVKVTVADVLLLGDARGAVFVTAPTGGIAIDVAAQGVGVSGLTTLGGGTAYRALGQSGIPLSGVSVRDVTLRDAVGGADASGIGLYTKFVEGLLVDDVLIENVTGGTLTAPPCVTSNPNGSILCVVPVAPSGYGLFLNESPNAVLRNLSVDTIAGRAGTKIPNAQNKVGRGGPAGSAIGIELATGSDDALIEDSTIHNIIGGKNGVGWTWSGRGGDATGLRVTNASGTELKGVSMTTLSRGGVSNSNGNSGTAWGIYMAGVGNQTTLDSVTLNQAPLIYLYGADGVTVEGLTAQSSVNPTNYGQMAAVASKNITFKKNIIKGASVTSHAGTGITSGPGLSNFGVRFANCTDCIFEGNLIQSVTGGRSAPAHQPGWVGGAYGLHVSGSPNVIVRKNTVRIITGGQAGPFEGVGTQYTPVYPAGGGAIGIQIQSSDGFLMEKNIIETVHGGLKGHSTTSDGGAIGVQISTLTGGAVRHALIRDIVGGSGTGLRISTTVDTVYEHLSVYGALKTDPSQSGIGIAINATQTTPVVIRNSVSRGHSNACVSAHPFLSNQLVTTEYSAMYACGFSGTLINSQAGAGFVEATPQFVAASQGNLHLLPLSPGIDVGVPTDACGEEPEPNGCRVNAGYYGGTGEATPSDNQPHCSPVCP